MTFYINIYNNRDKVLGGDSMLVKIFNSKNKLQVRSKNEKNIKFTILLILLVIFLTGCVKFNPTM